MKRRELLAFEMELQGIPRKKIEEATQYKENTLNAYFAKNGLWCKEYHVWAQNKLKELDEQIRDMLVANSFEAAQTIIKLVHSDDPHIALKAAGIVLDRAGFEKNSSMMKQENPVIDIAEMTVRAIEERNRQRDQSNKQYATNA